MNHSYQPTFKLYFTINRQTGSFQWTLLKLNRKDDNIDKNADKLLEIGKRFFKTEENQNFLFCGEMQAKPLGSALLEENGNILIPLTFMETSAGFPWILLDLPYAIEACVQQNGRVLKPVGEVQNVEALFLTENELNLTQEAPIGA